MSSNVGRLAYELHEVIYSQSRGRHFASLDLDYHVFGFTASGEGPWIMQAKKDCASNGSGTIDLLKGDLLDSCVSIKEKKNIVYGYLKRLKKFGHFHQSCLYYLADNQDYPDYSKSDGWYQQHIPDMKRISTLGNICMKSSITDIGVI
ncbi:hypothetical protein TrispH2_011001 [Trichoplax sp. H2]|nr:hypothetical protein TrispH2_011001 [Trichoplax sp. H2]|eukprot:RDD37608.1 hypothetical protein TrispH2_011001 [Trichoplax sp. H2]